MALVAVSSQYLQSAAKYAPREADGCDSCEKNLLPPLFFFSTTLIFMLNFPKGSTNFSNLLRDLSS